jgi:hypothetical protein
MGVIDMLVKSEIGEPTCQLTLPALARQGNRAPTYWPWLYLNVAFGSPLSFPEKGAISRPPLAGAIGCKCDVGQIHSMEMEYQRA